VELYSSDDENDEVGVTCLIQLQVVNTNMCWFYRWCANVKQGFDYLLDKVHTYVVVA